MIGSGLHLPLLVTLLIGHPATASAPAKVVHAFYEYHFAHEMAFTPESVRAKSKWLAPELIDLCDAYFRRPSSPDEVPAIDGDPFTDSQEYPRKFEVGRGRVTGGAARVPVRMYWSHGPPRNVVVELVSAGGQWRIQDVSVPNGPSLRQLLSK